MSAKKKKSYRDLALPHAGKKTTAEIAHLATIRLKLKRETTPEQLLQEAAARRVGNAFRSGRDARGKRTHLDFVTDPLPGLSAAVRPKPKHVQLPAIGFASNPLWQEQLLRIAVRALDGVIKNTPFPAAVEKVLLEILHHAEQQMFAELRYPGTFQRLLRAAVPPKRERRGQYKHPAARVPPLPAPRIDPTANDAIDKTAADGDD